MTRRARLILASAFFLLGQMPGMATASPGPDSTVLRPASAYETHMTGDFASAARALPGFAGMYLDRSRGGRAVVLLTSQTDGTDAALSASAANHAFDVRMASHSYAELQASIDLTWKIWPATVGTERPIAVALNTIANGLDIYVPWQELDAVQKASGVVSEAVGVEVRILGSDEAVELACSRENCVTPEKAGIVIHRGSVNGAACTMAFHVRKGTDEQFLTAGHCGHNSPQSFYHRGLPGYAMAPIATALGPGGFDIKRVNLSDSQASPMVYGAAYPVTGWRWPVVGQSVFVSAGVSDRVIENFVLDDYMTWYMSACSCTVYGTKTTYHPGGMAGDSGSPVFMLGWNGDIFAVGVASSFVGNGDTFARVGDAVNRWGLTMVTP